MKRRRRLRQAGFVLAMLVAAAVLLLKTDRAGELACQVLRERLPGALGADVSIGRCELDPLTASVRLLEVSVREQGTARELLAADEAAVAVRGLRATGLALSSVTVVRPRVALTVGPGGEAEGGACPLDLLKRLEVAKVEVQEGSLSLSFPEGRELRLEGVALAARLERRRSRVELTTRSGSVRLDQARRLSLGKVSVAATLDAESRELVLEKGEVSVEGITASATGRVESLCDAVPQLALAGQLYVPLAVAPRFGVPLDAPQGQIWSRLTVSGRADAPLVRADLQASQVAIGPFTPGDFSARLAWSGTRVELDELLTRSGDGEVRLSGDLMLTAGFPVRVRVETKEASLARILDRASIRGAWVDFPATVKGTLSGHLMPTPSLSGDIDFQVGHFELASRAWDGPKSAGSEILAFAQGGGKFRFVLGEGGVTFEDIDASVGEAASTRATGRVRLNFDVAKGIEVRAQLVAADLRDFGSIAGLPWLGQGTGSVTVLGPYADVVIDGQVSMRDFELSGYSLGVVQGPLRYVQDTLTFPAVVAQKGRTQYFGDVALAFGPEGVHTRGSVQMPDGRVEDVIDLLAHLSPSLENIQGPLVGRVSAVGAIDSPASQVAGVIAMQLSDVEYYGRRAGAGSAVLRFEKGEALVLEPTALEGPLGRLTAGGRWLFAGPLDFDLAYRDGALGELVDPAGGAAIPVSGTFASSAHVGGDTDVFLVTGELACPEVLWRGRSLGPMKLTVNDTGREADLGGDVIAGVHGTMKLHMRDDWPYEAAFSVKVADVGALLPPSLGAFQVALGGTVDATGLLKDFSSVRATALLDRLSIARGEVSAANVGPVELAWNAGALDVRALQLKGPTTELRAEGVWGPTTVDLKTRGSVDLRLLQSFVPQLERPGGQLDFTAAFGGTVRAPSLAGRAEVRDGRFGLRGEDVSVRALSGTASFSEARVLLTDWKGFVNEGRLRARGDVRLERFSIKGVELQVDLEQVPYLVLPETPATVSGSFLLASRQGGPYELSGGLEVTKFHYTQPLQLESVLARASGKATPRETAPEAWLRYDVDLTTGTDVRIENNLARGRLVGKLKVTGTNAEPKLVGAVEFAEGAQAFFRGNTYSVGRALLQFNGLWPTFDFAAQTQVREYLVSVKAFGRFEDPKLSLTSDPALPERDVFSLLTMGVTSRDKFAEQSGVSIVGEALLSATGLDQQLQKFLQQNVGLKDQQVRLTTLYNEATGTAEPSVSWESKLLVDNFKVGVTQPVTTGVRGTKAQAEWRFNQSVSARVQWENFTQTTYGNPGFDFRLRFEWE